MLVGGAILAAAVAVLLVVWPGGVSYQGKSIKTWFYAVGDLRSLPDPELERKAFTAMGSRAVPFLIGRLEAAPSERITVLLSHVWPTASLVYRQHKEMWQCRAAYLLGEIGPTARSAEPILAKWSASGNWSMRGEATVALMKIRQQPPDVLMEQLKDTSDFQAWYEKAMMVGEFGSRAERAIPIFLEALQHTNNVIQAHALIALGMIARQPEKCIPAILPFLTSPNLSDRQKAIGALRCFGTNAFIARTAIQSALADPDRWVRLEAERAMKKLGPMAGSEGGTKKAEPASPANVASPHR